MARVIFAYADTQDELNTSWWRCFIPAQELSDAGYNVSAHHIGVVFSEMRGEAVQRDIDEAEVVVLERLLLRPWHGKITEWQRNGKRVIATFDDNYALIPKSGGVSYQSWLGGERQRTVADELLERHGIKPAEGFNAILEEFREGLGLVDGALVPSRVLADDYRPYCANIQYVPNYPHLPLWKNVLRRPQDGNIVIGWGGSSAHDISWRDSGLAPALGALCRRHPRVHVSVFGLGATIKELLDRHKVRYEGHVWVPFDRWPHEVAKFDIYVIPCAGAYDLRRSYLKTLEAGMADIPWVASDVGVYDEAMGGVLVKNNPLAWERALTPLIEDVTYRRNLSQQGQLWAHKMAKECVGKYEDVLGLLEVKGE